VLALGLAQILCCSGELAAVAARVISQSKDYLSYTSKHFAYLRGVN